MLIKAKAYFLFNEKLIKIYKNRILSSPDLTLDLKKMAEKHFFDKKKIAGLIFLPQKLFSEII